MLGLGTTQLYNFRNVYNYKRHGNFKLGNRLFHFIRKQRVPDVLTAEFLLIDLLNNINDLAKDQPSLLSNIVKKIKKMDAGKLRRFARDYGTVGTRKFLEQVPA